MMVLSRKNHESIVIRAGDLPDNSAFGGAASAAQI
jgi:hypothetical protein